MKPIEFVEANKTLTKPEGMTEKQCQSLPVFTDGDVCISCWKFNLKERFEILLSGILWCRIRSGKTQPPIVLGTKYPF